MIIFIGGPPRVGKSILARRLAKEISYSYTSTDALRKGAKQLDQIPKSDPLSILERVHEEDDPEKFYSEYTPQQIIDFQNQESHEVVKVVKGFIMSTWEHRQDFIVEGVALLPSLIDKEFVKKYNINFITVGNIHYPSFVDYSWRNRGDMDWLREFDRETFEKVIFFCCEFSKVFKKQSEERNIPFFEIKSESFENSLSKIIKFF